MDPILADNIARGCAFYVDNWFYGYQVYCANPTEYWLNPLGWIAIIIIASLFGIFYLRPAIENQIKKWKM